MAPSYPATSLGGWPVIDVTRRSVEETAAAVINILSGGTAQVEVIG